jgi:predicted amino acid racemase
MNRVIINLEALHHNLQIIDGLLARQGAHWSVVTKCLCGHHEALAALAAMGVRSVCDSRLDNLRAVQEAAPGMERWYLRLPHLSVIDDIIALSDVSLNTEIEIIAALSRAAVARGTTHSVVIMIELGDLREGILPSSLVKFYEQVFDMPAIHVIGIGAQIGCMAGSVPNVDQVAQLVLYRELLELKFNRSLPLVSAGSSIFLPLVLQGRLPRAMNHYRIGEALFLGTDLVHGGRLEGLRDDVVTLEAEVAEIKEKNLVPLGEVGTSQPFHGLSSAVPDDHTPGKRGFRALVTIGEIDTNVSGLSPVDSSYQVAGASSDITVVNIGDDKERLHLGSTIKFRCSYSAFVRLMNDPYIAKQVTPALPEFVAALSERGKVDVAPCLKLALADMEAGVLS